MRKITQTVIFGAGGHGRVILDILIEAGIEVAGFIDEDKAKKGKSIDGYKVLGGWDILKNDGSLALALGIGDNKSRERVFAKALDLCISIVSAIHPKAVISRTARLGKGIAVMPGAIINAGVILEDGVVLNTGATLDHDCIIKRFAQIWPGAHLAGSITVGELSYIGTGSSVIQNIKIGDNSIIGASAAVISDIPSEVVAVGVPARVIKKNEK